ncbi:hypothetical protein [Telmatospirillum sp.]|uniref:hypothetical protein n=1 Tax=Telmatospirillum sp. TaxID=2079197 RepID=UPI00283AD057|nr:hypothetical protein [Telmatospirillum sp.]MDR3439883.1 hypothetical protein [Telmatospirillum sp.]
MSCGGGGSGSSQNSQSSSQLDPQIKQAELDWYSNQQKIQQAAQGASLNTTQTPVTDASGNAVLDANGNPTYTSSSTAKAYTPYTGQKVASLDPYTTNAETNYQTGSYQPANTAGVSAATSAAGYSPQQVTGQGVTAGSLANTDLSSYLNPYTKDVTNTTINDFTRASKINGVNSQQQATLQGAFGGSGQGVFQANNQDNLDRTLASTLSNLNQSNFTNAQTQATNDLNRNLSANEFSANATNTANLANQSAGLTANGQKISAASTLGTLGQQAQAGQTTDLTNGMTMGTTNQANKQSNLDWNYQNNYYNPNYMQPQWDVQMANAGQGNMPTAQTLSASTGSGGSASGNASC